MSDTLPVTIRRLREHYHTFFHPTQDWFEHEPFYDEPLPRYMAHDGTPTGREPLTSPPRSMPSAVELVALYVLDREAEVWRDYLWTSTLDSQGQRVYVGGTANGRGFEIHRHLHLTERWGVPTWNETIG
jgi:hypothetical protein